MKSKKVLKCFGIIFLFLTFSSIFFAIFNINPTSITKSKYIIYLSISNLLLVFIFILIYKEDLINDFKKFKNNIYKNLLFSIKYWIIGLFIMYVVNLFIKYILRMDIPSNEDIIRSYININPLLMAFNTIICSPINEELVFRKSIKDAINNKWVFILVSGLLFGFLHVVTYINSITDYIYLIPYAAFGICFSYIYYKTDNIYSTISIHIMHNILAFILYLLGVSL